MDIVEERCFALFRQVFQYDAVSELVYKPEARVEYTIGRSIRIVYKIAR